MRHAARRVANGLRRSVSPAAAPPALQPAVRRALAQQPEYRVAIRGRHAELAPEFREHAEDRPDLERAPRFEILQHRRLERAELARDRDPLGPAHSRRQTEPCADRGRLLHHPQREILRERIVEQLLGRRARQRAQWIHVHVAPQLRPDLGPDRGRRLDVETARRERRGEPGRGDVKPLIGCTDDQPVAAPTAHDARRVGTRRQVHDATDRLRGRQRRRHRAGRIDSIERHAVERPFEPVREPPRQAVHRRDDHGVRPDQRRNSGGQRRQHLSLQGDHHVVLHAERGRIVTRSHRNRRCLARLVDHTHAVRIQRIERRATRIRTHDHAGPRQRGRQQPADRADPDHRRAHRP